MNKLFVLFLFTFLLFSTFIFSEVPLEGYSNDLSIPLVANQKIEGWGGFKLGKNYDDIAELFETIDFIELSPMDSLYPDIVEPGEDATINIKENNFFEIFQLKFTTNKKLYLIQMKLSKKFFSFNRLYERLKEKYGPSQIVRARKVTWTNATRKLILTRDNRLKYIAIDELPLNTNSYSFFVNQASEDIKENILQGL